MINPQYHISIIITAIFKQCIAIHHSINSDQFPQQDLIRALSKKIIMNPLIRMKIQGLKHLFQPINILRRQVLIICIP
jgi:hypothetical protein